MAKTLKDISKQNWSGKEGQTTFSLEEIRLGALLRMADSMEVMAKDRVKLEKDLAFYQELSGKRWDTIESLTNRVRGQKSVVTRYKNKITSLEKSLSELLAQNSK